MVRVRITIARLMGVVVVSAIGLAALSHPTPLCASIVFSLVLGLHFAAVVATIATDGRARSTWAGFAVCGWGYLVLVLAPWFDSQVRPYLITSSLIDDSLIWLDDAYNSLYAEYLRIAHSLCSVIAGLVGALLGRRLSRRPNDPAPSTISNTGPS